MSRTTLNATFSGRRLVSPSGVVSVAGERYRLFSGRSHRSAFRVLSGTSETVSSTHTHGQVYESPALDETVVVERSAHSTPQGQVDAVVSVCTHKHCCKRGALSVLHALREDAARAEGLTIDVRCSTCLGHCKKGPSVHVSLASGEEVVAVKVESGHDVQQLAAVAMCYEE